METIRHESGFGRWTLVRHRPSGDLAPFVIEIQGYAEEAGRPVVRKELPSGRVPLILVLDGPGFRLREAAAERPLCRSFVAGLHGVPAIVGSPGVALCMQVDFTPVGARRFLAAPLGDLTGRVEDLSAVVGRRAAGLEDELASLPDWRCRILRLEDHIAARILPGAPEPPLVLAAWQAIRASGGTLAVAALATRLGVSGKHLSVSLRAELGQPPKTLSRLVRFERSVRSLAAGRPGSLADLAQACGFADQAHLTRDVLAFAGETPSALRRRMLADGTGLMADDGGAPPGSPVTDVQDVLTPAA